MERLSPPLGLALKKKKKSMIFFLRTDKTSIKKYVFSDMVSFRAEKRVFFESVFTPYSTKDHSFIGKKKEELTHSG